MPVKTDADDPPPAADPPPVLGPGRYKKYSNQEAIGLARGIEIGYGKDVRQGVGIPYTRKSLIHIAVQKNNVGLVYTEVGGRV